MDPVHPPSLPTDRSVDAEPAGVTAGEHDPDVAAALAAERVANDYHSGLPGER